MPRPSTAVQQGEPGAMVVVQPALAAPSRVLHCSRVAPSEPAGGEGLDGGGPGGGWAGGGLLSSAPVWMVRESSTALLPAHAMERGA